MNDHISLFSYFKKEKKLLILTAITGMIYNIGMTAGPLFEGQLAQYLFDILKGIRKSGDIMRLSILYVIVIGIVQAARALKRLYVRKFANNVSASMKKTIYHHLVGESYAQIQREDTGSVMTRAIADAEACAEGMRKFTTEIFDTGVVMIAYLVMLLVLDWRLTLIVILFPPVAYIASGALKKKVTDSSSQSRIAMSELNGAAVDNISHALTYRIYGENENRRSAYEDVLQNYEKKNITAGIWQNSPQPVYLVISMAGVIPILLFGGRNVLGSGWNMWTIASFSSFLSCFTRLATKSSHAAKLFNAVQKAQVSWERIRDYLTEDDGPVQHYGPAGPADLVMEHVNFGYSADHTLLHDLNLHASPGQIIGITGKVASGKSTFGKLFLQEYPYEGKILYEGRDISESREMIFAYMGHDPELFTGSIRENITFGRQDEARLQRVLKEAQLDREVSPDTMAGTEGNELSGGQQARVALARALYSEAPVLILDDPFSAVDQNTERELFKALRQYEPDRIILIISHRLAHFPEMDRVVFLDSGRMRSGSHDEMMRIEDYADLYEMQRKGGSHE